MALATTHLLYLHGFRSSPQSFKAQLMARWVAEHRPAVHWWAPQLPASPREALALVQQGTADWPQDAMAVVGSSLGGWYATWLACQRGCRAVLLNPAVRPARDLARYIGEHPVWQNPAESIFFRPEYVGELRHTGTADVHGALSIPEQMRPRLLAVIAKGDEVLSWQEMSAAYAGCRVRLLEGSDHGLGDFADHLPEVTAFLGL